MPPKEKAKELFDKMQINAAYLLSDEISKEKALISVDEIIKFLLQCSKYWAFPKQVQYWQEVKQEIIKL